MTYKFMYFKPKDGASVLLDFDPAKLHLATPEQKQGHQKSIEVSYDYNGVRGPVRMQFPRMHTPFELSHPPPYKDAPPKRYKTYNVSFRGEEHNPELKSFRKHVVAVDNAIVDKLTQKSREWFPTRGNRGKTRDSIEDGYCGPGGYSMIKRGSNPLSDKQYPDRIEIRVPVKSGVASTKFFDGNRVSIIDETSIVMQGGEAESICVLPKLWVVNACYYPSFVALQTQIFPVDVVEEEYGFVHANDNTDVFGLAPWKSAHIDDDSQDHAEDSSDSIESADSNDSDVSITTQRMRTSKRKRDVDDNVDRDNKPKRV